MKEILIEYIPLQQGLRPSSPFVQRIFQLVRLIEYIPLQQGLRPNSRNSCNNSNLIEYIPLQQGLRQIATIATVIPTLLIEYIPLQQGLRHNCK